MFLWSQDPRKKKKKQPKIKILPSIIWDKVACPCVTQHGHKKTNIVKYTRTTTIVIKVIRIQVKSNLPMNMPSNLT